MNPHAEHVRSFWQDRARMGAAAGSNDVIAKQIEIDAIMKFMHDGLDVLDVGCGNGITAIAVAQKFEVRFTALDYADEMVRYARAQAAQAELKGSLAFSTGDVRQLPGHLGLFDVIISERVLINLNSWEEQQKAITDIAAHLKQRGTYVMCENSIEGLDSINALRVAADLPPIAPPWHNCYLSQAKLAEFNPAGLRLVDVRHIASTYALLSRVVNAWLAKQEGCEPSYDAPANTLALKLPAIGDFGQTKIWVWRKE